jgi:hypothetical protein
METERNERKEAHDPFPFAIFSVSIIPNLGYNLKALGFFIWCNNEMK